MKKEDLLKPRYKVIADYPAQHYSVGNVINTDNPKLCSVCEDEFWLFDLDKYPHLFRKLEWWEERKVEDMPKYIKFVDNGFVCKVDCIMPDIGFNFFYSPTSSGYGKRVFSNNTIPATLEEYTTYLTTLK